MKRAVLIVVVVYLSMLITSVSAIARQISLQTGYSLFMEAHYDEAAAQWNMLGDSLFAINPKDVRSLRDVAFAYILATVAYERSFDARAYDMWGTSIRHYLECGTSWDAERLRLAQQVNEMTVQMSLSESDATSNISTEESLIVEIVQELQLAEYTGPGLGLIRRDESSEIELFVDTLTELPQRGFQYDNSGLFSRSEKGETAAPEVSTSRGIYPLTASPPPDTVQVEIPKPRLEPMVLTDSVQESTDRVAEVDPDTSGLRENAAEAWKYFLSNYRPETGMVDPVRGYTMGTMWDIGSNLAGYVAAERIGLIDRKEFLNYLDPFLRTLGSLKLYEDELPNREYDVLTGKPKWEISPNSRKGSGWSALDIGRILIWFKITANWYPERAEAIREIVAKWKFDRLSMSGEMNGVWFDGRLEKLRQEGRWGYEQYSASGFEAWGIPIPRAFDALHLDSIMVGEVKLLYDKRNLAWLTSEPFILAGLELAKLDSMMTFETHSLYEAQKQRASATGTLCAVSEDAVDRKPYFVYNCVYYSGKEWVTLSHRGKPEPSAASLSTKACFGWFALFPDEYSKKLWKEVLSLTSRDGGYYGGIYTDGTINKSRNINSNAVILEAILYRLNGEKGFLN